MSARAWKIIFNGVDQKGTSFEVPSDELDKWRSANAFLKPSKEAVDKINSCGMAVNERESEVLSRDLFFIVHNN